MQFKSANHYNLELTSPIKNQVTRDFAKNLLQRLLNKSHCAAARADTIQLAVISTVRNPQPQTGQLAD